MSKHTPGPWKAGARSVSAPETGDRLPLDCRLFGGNAGDNRANARLIAASPDLLAAAREALSSLESVFSTQGQDDDWIYDEMGSELAAGYFSLRYAIAKASGAE